MSLTSEETRARDNFLFCQKYRSSYPTRTHTKGRPSPPHQHTMHSRNSRTVRNAAVITNPHVRQGAVVSQSDPSHQNTDRGQQHAHCNRVPSRAVYMSDRSSSYRNIEQALNDLPVDRSMDSAEVTAPRHHTRQFSDPYAAREQMMLEAAMQRSITDLRKETRVYPSLHNSFSNENATRDRYISCERPMDRHSSSRPLTSRTPARPMVIRSQSSRFYSNRSTRQLVPPRRVITDADREQAMSTEALPSRPTVIRSQSSRSHSNRSTLQMVPPRRVITDIDREQAMLEEALQRSLHDISLHTNEIASQHTGHTSFNSSSSSASRYNMSFCSEGYNSFVEEVAAPPRTVEEPMRVRRLTRQEEEAERIRLERIEHCMLREAMERSLRDIN